MKNRILLIMTAVLFMTANEAKAEIPIIYSNGVEIEKVLELPQKDKFEMQASNGNWYHADVGILHKQFSVFWIPLINYGEEKYVLYSNTKVGEYDFTYAELDQDEIEYLQKEFSGLPSTPELPFWDAWGGKLLLLLLVLVAFWIIRM